MKYISIGAVINPANESIVEVSHGGNTFKLTGELAYIWLSGRFQFSHASTILEQKALQQLLQMGLAKPCDGTEAGEYRALTQCTIVAAKTARKEFFLPKEEQRILTWLREAGLVLTISELVFLMDRNIVPTRELLGSEHAQKLVETIYTKENIFDNLLDNQMEHAQARDKTVKLIMALLKKRKLVLL